MVGFCHGGNVPEGHDDGGDDDTCAQEVSSPSPSSSSMAYPCWQGYWSKHLVSSAKFSFSVYTVHVQPQFLNFLFWFLNYFPNLQLAGRPLDGDGDDGDDGDDDGETHGFVCKIWF